MQIDATSSDLTPYFAHGGKLLMFHGWADPNVAPRNTINLQALRHEQRAAEAAKLQEISEQVETELKNSAKLAQYASQIKMDIVVTDLPVSLPELTLTQEQLLSVWIIPEVDQRASEAIRASHVFKVTNSQAVPATPMSSNRPTEMAAPSCTRRRMSMC